MFAQSSHFIEEEGQDTMKRVTVYGQEKSEMTSKLARTSLAVHGMHVANRVAVHLQPGVSTPGFT
ncbi:MAG: N-6 DNA methylase [Roseobacter sp.]|jgi:type I restriction-modification system DNA methylase subunit|nr:N-6 DNA methylase [Roseobacter sp.]